MRFGEFQFDASTGDLYRAGEVVALEPLARAALGHLIRNRGRVVSRDELIEEVWGGRRVVDEAVTRVIGMLRRELGDDSKRQVVIRTWARRGYQFVASVDEALAGRGDRLPLVGRAAAFQELRSAADEAAQGHGGLRVVSGPPGIGKTRLLEELATRAGQQGARVEWGWCYGPAGEPPYWPWVTVLRRLLGQRDPKRLDEWLGRNDALHLGRMLSSFSGAGPEPSAAVAAVGPEEDRFRLFDAVWRLLAREAEAAPLVIVIEDLHWAEPASLELLAFLAPALAESRVLLLASLRDTETTPGDAVSRLLAELARQRGFGRIDLEGLDREGVRELLVAMQGREPSAPRVDALAERTGGNPFFLKEIALAGGDEEDGHALPLQVEDAIGSLLARVSAEARECLAAAALLGREFDPRFVSELVDRAPEEVHRGLEEALAASLLVEARDTDRLAFAHALIQEFLTAHTSAARRQHLHLRIARALEAEARAAGTAPGEAELAHHYCQAPIDGVVLDKAIDFSLRAAEQAYRAAAWEETIARTREPLRLIEKHGGAGRDEATLALLQWKSRALNAARGYTNPELMDDLQRAAELCEALGKGRERIRVLLMKGACHLIRGEYQESERDCSLALELATRDGDAAGSFAGHTYLAIVDSCTGSMDDAQQHLEQAERLRDPAWLPALSTELGQDQDVTHLTMGTTVGIYLGDPELAFERSRRAIAAAEAGNDAYSIAYAYYFATTLRLLAGHDLEHGRAVAKRSLALCRERRIPFFAALALFQGGALRAALGEGEAGLEEMDRGVAELMALGATKYLATWACFSRGVVLRQVGRDEEAMAMANAGLALAIETHESLVEAELHRLKGELQEQTGATDAAKASYRNALASAREQGSRWFELRAATRLANLHRKEGDPERARELLAPLVDRFPQSLDMAVLAEARGLLETL